MDDSMISRPHVLMFPIPSLGDMSPMLKLAELLCLANVRVTFINTVYNHKRLTEHANIEERFSRYPGFQFKVIPDGVPEDHPRAGLKWFALLFPGLKSNVEPFLREVMPGSGHKSQFTCLITDSHLRFAFDVAYEAEVPVIEFRASGASFFWIFFSFPKLVEAGEIPFKDDDMDKLIQNVPGMGDFLRRCDLPHFFQIKDKLDTGMQQSFQRARIEKAHATILNTFEELEGPILSQLHAVNRSIYSIGPLHAHLKLKISPTEQTTSKSSGNVWNEDRSCISWLDKKPDKSVIYVSFGSIATLTRDQLQEIWAGLVHSQKYFLWVLRPGMISETDSDSPTADELLEGTKERGLMVGWVPQEEILAHRAVGGFLTHGGWNSILESTTAGVPMLCWPCFSDQLSNSRFISEVWRIGLDMKGTCDRSIVAKMVRELMDERKDEFQQSAAKMSNLAKKSVTKGGSSYCNFNRLIEDIKLMSKTD